MDKKLNKNVKARIIFNRSSSIPRYLNNTRLYLYNGNNLNKVRVNTTLGGKKFGEFSVTRKPFFYPKKDKKKR